MNKLVLIAFATLSLAAQDFHNLIGFEGLKSKASETVEVNLDGNLLNLAQKFLSDTKPDEAKAKQILQGLKGIYVRSLKFDKEGEYPMSSVEQIRSQFTAPTWQPVVDVHGKGTKKENVGVFIKSDGDKIQGLVVIAAEAKELTVVNLIGSISPEQLKDLSGQYGIPNIQFTNKGKKSGKDE